MTSGDQFRVPDAMAPPAIVGTKNPKDWPSYATLLEAGGDTRLNTQGAAPADDRYFKGKFWSYDGTSGLCAPAQLYNQIADQVLPKLHTTDPTEIARYYAMINLAMGDAGIAAWESKYYFQFARPVTAIRYQRNLDNPNNAEEWYPLGAQATNADQTYNITPPFPAYPSGHAVFGGAFFQILRKFVPNPADQTFTFLSDEFNGKNKDIYNFIRCQDGDKNPQFCSARTFATFTVAESENAMSRVYLGVHWQFDSDDGIAMGNKIGDWTFQNTFTPE